MQAIRTSLRPLRTRFNLSSIRNHGGPSVDVNAPKISITFLNPHPSKDKKEESVDVEAKVGETLLQTAHRHGIDLEGACEGVCACSTCHVIFDDDVFDRLEEASEDEEDMLGKDILRFNRLDSCHNFSEDINQAKTQVNMCTNLL